MPLPITIEAPRPRSPKGKPGGWLRRRVAAVSVALTALMGSALWGQAPPTYQIQSATPATIAAGASGATITLTGTLPNFAQGAYQVCFYPATAIGGPITPTAGQNGVSLLVPAATIQAIPAASFTAANGYAVAASIYIVVAGGVCDGTVDATLTNSVTVTVVEPTLGVYSGPTDIPQTNSATNIQAAPISITLNGSNFVAATTVSFGTFGSVTPKLLSPSAISVVVPQAFSSSQAGTAAALTVCNSVAGGANYCSTPAAPITLSVTALSQSVGTITVTPTPVTTAVQTVLTAQFAQAPGQAASAGAPSGTVVFTAGGTALPAANLILDKTATFTTQVSVVSTLTTATPTITPAAGSYVNSATITIADATPGAAIYYTQDGTVPTAASILYTGPFNITTSQTIQALAVAPGYLNSVAVSAAYVISVNPPTQLAFLVQPSNTGNGAAITPAVQVAIEDVNGNTVTSSTSAVTIALSANPGDTTLNGTTTVNAVNGVATFPGLNIAAIANGYTLIATSGTLTPATSAAFNITLTPITMTVQSALIGIGSTLTGSFTLGEPAPLGGVVVTLASSAPANATIAPATVTVAGGQTTGAFTYTGVAAGAANLTASAANYLTGTVQVTGTAAQVSLGTIPAVAPGQMMSLAMSLPSPAPAGGTTVTFTSSAPNVATVTASVFVPAGQQTPAANPQVTGVIIGTSTITAFAPGFAPATRTATVTVTAAFNPGATNINLVTSSNTTLNISAPAPAGGITFTLISDNPAVATVPASVTVLQGGTSVPVAITGVAAGSTTIRADSAGITEATGTVNVASAIAVGNVTTGVSMETTLNLYLPIAPLAPVTVTVTSTAPATATISKSATVTGVTTLTFTNVTSSYVGTISVQGQRAGSTTITESAPGFTTGSGTVAVDPSGFSFYPYAAQDFSTTTFSTPTTITLYTTIFDPTTGAVVNYGLPLNPGVAPISVPVTSATTAVGTIVTSPVVFQAGATSTNTTFQPATTGTSIVKIGMQPAPFSVPSYAQQLTATVTTPVIIVSNPTTGVDLENYVYVSLPVAPPTGETVTVTSNGPAIATIANTSTTVGGTTLTFTNVTSAGVGYVYIQGQSVGTTTLTLSAPGYTSGSGTITVLQSGFTLYYDSNFSTTTLSAPTTVTAYTASLNPTSLTVNQVNLPLNPGLAPVNVPVTSSNTAIGTITTSPVVFASGASSGSTTFQPVAAGMTNLTVGTPAGFSTPSQYTQITATVTAAPMINIGSVTTGVNLEVTTNICLPVTPQNPVTVTVTSGGAAIISKSDTVTGGTTLTFTGVTGCTGTIYVQGQSVGSTTLNASSPGYTSGSATVTVNPSGFVFYGNQSFTTTTFSTATGLTVFPSILNPTSLTVYEFGVELNPGLATINVPVANSTPAVGTITTSPVVFNSGNNSNSTSFQPLAAGMSTVSIATPSGFSTPSQYTQLVATVTAPAISVGNSNTGANLETTLGIGLPVAPPNPITVTVTSNGPAIATISNSGTVVGGTTLTFTNVTSTSVGTIYVQGQSVGSTTITVSAPGYTNAIGDVTVAPSGFAFNGDNSFMTYTTSSATQLTVYPFALTAGTLTVATYPGQLSLNPGLGMVGVPMTSSNNGVGSITTSPIVFSPGDSYDSTTFQPVGAGMSTLTVGTPTGFSTPSQYQQITATVAAP